MALGFLPLMASAANYNFNFYNNDQPVNIQGPQPGAAGAISPGVAPVPNSLTAAAPTTQAPVPVPEEKTLKYRVSLSAFRDSFNKPNSENLPDEAGYATKRSGYQVGLGLGTKGGFIFTPYFLYTTTSLMSPTRFTSTCYLSQAPTEEQGLQYVSNCYDYADRQELTFKLPGAGLQVEKEFVLGDLFVAGIGLGGFYSQVEQDDNDLLQKQSLKQMGAYASAKFGIQIRPEIFMSVRGDYGKMRSDVELTRIDNVYDRQEFKLTSTSVRTTAELSILF